MSTTRTLLMSILTLAFFTGITEAKKKRKVISEPTQGPPKVIPPPEEDPPIDCANEAVRIAFGQMRCHAHFREVILAAVPDKEICFDPSIGLNRIVIEPKKGMSDAEIEAAYHLVPIPVEGFIPMILTLCQDRPKKKEEKNKAGLAAQGQVNLFYVLLWDGTTTIVDVRYTSGKWTFDCLEINTVTHPMSRIVYSLHKEQV